MLHCVFKLVVYCVQFGAGGAVKITKQTKKKTQLAAAVSTSFLIKGL